MQGSRPDIDLVLLDMDGVIFTGRNFWLELHREYGTAEHGAALADHLMDRDYDRLTEIVVGRLWKGRSAQPLERLVETRKYEPGVRELFVRLHAAGIRTAIISSGPQQLAERAQRDLAIDDIRANHVEVVDGIITGLATIQVPDAEKSRVGFELIEQMGSTPKRTLFVGDSDSDAELVEKVGIGVAYGSQSPRLSAAADVVLPEGHLLELADLIASASATTRVSATDPVLDP